MAPPVVALQLVKVQLIIENDFEMKIAPPPPPIDGINDVNEHR